jgi:hypothetical protein
MGSDRRAWSLSLACFFVFALAASAQTPPPVQIVSSPDPVEHPSLIHGPAELLAPPEASPHWGGPWGLDLVFGLPTGVRVQKSLSANENQTLVVEGFAGLHYVICPTLGGGIRWRWAPICGPRDALILSPGVDAYFLLVPLNSTGAAGLVTADLDCAWRHKYSAGLVGEVGVKVGAGIAFANGSIGLPIVAVYTGFRY